MNQVERFTFSLDEFRDPPFEVWNDLSDEQKMKKWMLLYALDRAFDELISEKFLYVKSDLNIPPEQIRGCTEIPDSQLGNWA